MPWQLQETKATGQEVVNHILQPGRTNFIVLIDPNHSLAVVDAVNGSEALGSITIGPWGIKLEAIGDDLGVAPVQPRKNENASPPEEEYKLNRKGSKCSEIIFLRENDKIYFSKIATSLAIAWTTAEVQVNSSIAGDTDGPDLENLQNEEVTKPDEQLDDETEDEDLDQTITAVVATQSAPEPSNPQSSRFTPAPSAVRFDIVQETPTTVRVNDMPTLPSKDAGETSASEAADAEPFSTAPTRPNIYEIPIGTNETGDPTNIPQTDASGDTPEITTPTKSSRSIDAEDATKDEVDGTVTPESPLNNRKSSPVSHPSVIIPMPKTGMKRSSPDAHQSMTLESPSPRASKRLKKEDRENAKVETTTQKPAQRKRRGAPIADSGEASPTRTRASSQRSVAEDDIYSGPKPLVAFSNSAADTTNFIKFLNKQGGRRAQEVKDGECNILCVRDEPLKKSTKLLLCIALGIPIVTDNWLVDSSKIGHFVDTKPYIPQNANQQRELNFSLADVWGTPQPDLLSGKTVYFTPTLKALYNPFNEVQQVCKAVGARRSMSKLGKEVKDGADMIILAAHEKPDPDRDVLLENGLTCYTRDLLSVGILRGSIDLNSEEFQIQPRGSQTQQTKKRGRPRKG